MKHGTNKFKVRNGIDANHMLLRKLASNFITNGKIVTTEKKAKGLRTFMETLVIKSQADSTANTNYLLNKLGSPGIIRMLQTQVAPVTGDRKSGFITLRRLHFRLSDGAPMVEVRWSIPVVMEKPKKEVSEAKNKDEKPALPAEKVTTGQAAKTKSAPSK